MKTEARAVRRLVILCAMVGTVWVGPAPAAADSPLWAPPPLAELISEGLAQNKELQSLEAQAESYRREVSYSGSLDDPRLGLGVVNLPKDTLRFDQEPMTQKVVSIAQKIPWFGKLSLRSQRTALMVVRQEAMLKARQLELARQIATSYYELGFTAASERINDRLTVLVTKLLKVAETRYAAGMGLQQDVFQAQVELSRLLDEKIILVRQHRTLEDRINELLNRESFMQVTPTPELTFPDLKLVPEELKKQSLQRNPGLAVRQADVDQAEVGIQLAEKDYWPDPDFIVSYGQRDDLRHGIDQADFVSGLVTITIPLWQKTRQDSKLAATEKSHDAALKSYRNLAESLPYRVDSLVTEINDLQENYRLYADALIVQTELWARSSLAAYEVGKVEFNTMITAQIRVLRSDLQAQRYLYSIYQKRAELEEVLGGPLASSIGGAS
jgi:cobalt-zinc-cadmium efflux system outer membrane protein